MAQPRVDLKRWITVLDRLGSSKQLICPYCGNENLVTGDVFICSFCENALYRGAIEPRQNDQGLLNALALVNNMIEGKNFDAARTTYRKLLDGNKGAEYLYTYALLHISYSNSEVASIRYDRMGFMEENSVHREKASALDSKAKLILIKAQDMLVEEMKSGSDPYMAYSYFIISIKLGHLKTARKARDMMQTMNNPFLLAYENMVLAVETKNYAEVINQATALINGLAPPIGTFYYLSWALFKMGRIEDSMKLLVVLGKYLENASIGALMRDVEEARALA